MDWPRAVIAALLLCAMAKPTTDALRWNHVAGFSFVLVGVLVVLDGPWTGSVFSSASSLGAATKPNTSLGDTELLRAHDSIEHEGITSSPLPSPPSSPSGPPPTPLPQLWSPPLLPSWPPPPSMPASDALMARLSWLAVASRRERLQAISELETGHKRSHWIWWAFPTLESRGGDGNSAWQRADLADIGEATAYCAHEELRAGLLSTFGAARTAFAAVETRGEAQAAWRVLDQGFGREAVGEWVGGPVDSFKAWASVTLFAGLAQRTADAELHQAALSVLDHFHGDIVYIAAGPGTAGYVDDATGCRDAVSVLRADGDPVTLRMLGLMPVTLRRPVVRAHS